MGDNDITCKPKNVDVLSWPAFVFTTGEQIRKRRCKAAFSYLPQHEDELELKIGDVIEIIAEVRLVAFYSTQDGDFSFRNSQMNVF